MVRYSTLTNVLQNTCHCTILSAVQQLTKPSNTQSSTLPSVVTSTHPPPIDPPITIQTNHPVAEQSMKSFTEEFHQSVLEQTKQQLLCDVPTGMCTHASTNHVICNVNCIKYQ